jgi:hypothetical protein
MVRKGETRMTNEETRMREEHAKQNGYIICREPQPGDPTPEEHAKSKAKEAKEGKSK